jgi:two-component system sensor histidine kinase LytS
MKAGEAMEALTIVLFERIGMLLIFAFMMTRIPSFRYLLDRDVTSKTIMYHSIIFGIFGIAGAQAGVVISDESIVSNLWIFHLEDGETLVGSALVAIVISGLLGGPYVGFGAGSIVAIYFWFLGGEMVLANSLVNPISGLLAGFTARFFSQERVIAPAKALFIGMFTPILHMSLLLIFTSTPDKSIELVNTIGIPLVITQSIAIAIFTAMIRVALNEKEQEAALETKRALKIAEEALPYLRKGFHYETATKIAQLLQNELRLPAVSLTDKEKVLAHSGLGVDHHHLDQPVQTQLALQALQTGDIQIAYDETQCMKVDCPLQSAIIVPIRQSGEVTGLIYLYFKRSQQIRAIEVALAQGIGKLISNQLDVVAAEKMKALVQEAKLRNLQAQINPHFLFNTLNSIASLVRIQPDQARHLIVQLGYFMRTNLKLTSASLISLDQELKHLNAYLEIIRCRFSDQLVIRFDVENGICSANIPPFTLQPLVENCINHGLKDVSSGGMIQVNVKQINDQTSIVIRDNGVGIPSSVLKKLGKPIHSEQGNGVGIYNVNQRLISLLGENACLYFKTDSSNGTTVSFTIPNAENEGRLQNEA